MRETLTFLKKIFRVRQCEDSVFRHRSRPCLQYQIGRCTAPCVGFIDADAYARDVRRTRLFLEGKSRELTRELEREMEAASGRLEFEAAAQLRDQIAALRAIQAEQSIEAGSGDLDVIGVAAGAERACVHVLYVRRGHMLGSRSFYPVIPPGAEPGEVLAEFVSQHYLERGVAVDIPASCCSVPRSRKPSCWPPRSPRPPAAGGDPQPHPGPAGALGGHRAAHRRAESGRPSRRLAQHPAAL